MGDTEKCNNTDMIQRLHSSFCTSSSSIPKHPLLPPTSPYSQIRPGSNPNPNPNHSRSMSQPSSFFSFDSLPPLSPSPYMEDRIGSQFIRCNSDLPPRKSHRRSNSDNIPSGFNNVMIPLERSVSGGECSDWSVKKEGIAVEREAMDDLFSAYMNLENIDVLNSSEADDSRGASGNNKNGSDTEGESSSVNESKSVKRRAGGGHYRSVSVDSCFMDKMSLPPPSPGSLSRKVSPTNSVDGNSSGGFSIEFKNGEFTAAELKKIMANDKLSEMAMADPKRVKRILANRQSAARSKERKMRYIVELEHKVQTLQTEATTLSAQLTLLQRDMMGLTNQNSELKFRLQSMEQQARLRDALNEALTGEVQRLKLAIGETSNNESDRSKMQSLNAEMFQQLNISQLRQQPQSQAQAQQNQNVSMATKPESNE